MRKKKVNYNRINLALTIATKGKNPFTGEWDYKYLVPEAQCQRGSEWNYVIVCCEPSKNGVYRYSSNNTESYKRWDNNGKVCLYVPIEDCEFRDFWDIDWNEPSNKALRKGIIELQDAWFKGEIKNKEPHKRPKKPDWFLENILTSEGELEASYA